MAGSALAGKGSYDRQRGRHVTVVSPVHERHQNSDKLMNDPNVKDDANCAHWLAPVFGVAAAASIALYMRYMSNLKKRASAVRSMESKAFRASRKLMDLSLTAKNGTLIKSRSAFV